MKIKFLILLAVTGLLSSCEDYLDVVPKNDIVSINSIFEQKNTAEEYLNSCYAGYLIEMGDHSIDPSILGADEYMSSPNGREAAFFSPFPPFQIADGKQNSARPICSSWGESHTRTGNKLSNHYKSIRYCNTFIENIDKVNDMSGVEKAAWKAQAKSLKALYYFELIKKYGPIVLVPKNMGVEVSDKNMRKYRSHVDTCFARVDKLFEESIPHLGTSKMQARNKLTRLTREAVYAYRARAAVFAASPLFNGNSWYANFKNKEGKNLFSSSHDNKKWEHAVKVTDEAISFCEEAGHVLYTAISVDQSKRHFVNQVHDACLNEHWNNPEILHATYNASTHYNKYRLPRYNEKDDLFIHDIKGNLNPTIRMVELFYTKNGLPIDQDLSWNYEARYKLGRETSGEYQKVVASDVDVLNLHMQREPRFYANIAADQCYWYIDKNDILLPRYKNQRFGTTRNKVDFNYPQNLTGYWTKKLLGHEMWGDRGGRYQKDRPWPMIRMAHLYLMRAEAYNEAYGPGDKAYEAIDKVRERAGVPGVKKAWDEYSKQPGYYATKSGFRNIIRDEILIEFAFEGNRFWDLRRWKIAHEHLNKPLKGWNVFGEDSYSFYNSENGPISVHMKLKFESPRDYFWPISDMDVLKSDVVQNPGW